MNTPFGQNTHGPILLRQTLVPSTSGATGVSAEDLINQAEEHFNVSGTSVIAAWLLTFILGVVIVTIYSILRANQQNRFELFYFPRVSHQLHKKDHWQRQTTLKDSVLEPKIPKVSKAFFGWLTPQLKLFWLELWQPISPSQVCKKDQELLQLVGLDAVTYLQFLRLLRWLFLSITLFAALPLALANYYINTRTQAYGKDMKLQAASKVLQDTAAAGRQDTSKLAQNLLDNMMLFTMANITGNALWVHVGFEAMVTGFVIFFGVYSNYSLCGILLTGRLLFTRGIMNIWNQEDISFRSLLVTGFTIGEKRQGKTKHHQKSNTVSDAKIQICEMLGIPERPKTMTVNGSRVDAQCAVALTHKNMSRLARDMEAFKERHRPAFDRTLTSYLRRFCTPFGGGQEYESWWDRVLGRNAKDLETQTVNRGIDLKRRIMSIEVQQQAAQCKPLEEHTTKIEGTVCSAFVTFRSTKRAHAVLANYKKQTRYTKILGQPDVQRAPRPRNIIWRNLDKTNGLSKHGYSWAGWAALLVIFGFNTVPLAAVTVLANFQAVIAYFPVLQQANEQSSFWRIVFALLGGILPPGIAALCAYILPYVVRRMNKWSGALTRGQLDKTVVRQLFAWLLVFNFIFFSLLGIIWEAFLIVQKESKTKSLSEIFDSLDNTIAKITKAYISQSSYWLSWFPIRALMIILNLLQLPRWGLKIIQSITAKTTTDLHELGKPVTFEFAIEYIHILFAMVVALVYTPLAPIVPICSMVYFWAMAIVHYEQLVYVEDTKETDGKCWRIARNRLLASTVMMQVLTALTVWLKTGTLLITLMALMPITAVALLKYLEGEDDIFIKNSRLFEEHASPGFKTGPIPEYEHDLLRKDWMPPILVSKEDKPELERAKRLEKFRWMRVVIPNDSLGIESSRGKSRIPASKP